MIVSVTERQTYKRCRQMWEWGSFNRESWQPIVTKPALAIGRLWHATQAEWSLHPEEDPNELALLLANEELDRTRQQYLTAVGAPISEMELEPVYDQMGFVLQMVRNYHKRWGSPLPEGFRMVAPEQTCVVPIPGTEHLVNYQRGELGEGDPGGERWEPHYLEGTLDGLLADDFGRVYVLERKTYGQRPKVEDLNLQDQFLAYLWILRSLDLGDVGGLAYDGVWKRKEPPKGSTLEDLFLRVLLKRNTHELDNFGVQLAAEVTEMASDPAIYLNRRWDGCWDCDFKEPCVAKLRNENWRFLLENKFAPRPKSEDTVRELKATAA